MADEPDVEVVRADLKDEHKTWAQLVWEAGHGKCSNCGSDDHVVVRMIVPEEAGGRRVPTNGYLICRGCEMAQDTVQGARRREDRRPINFWVSRRLHSKLQNGLKTRYGYKSMGSLIRYLMAKYVVDEGRFDDLEQYQESGSDVKVNVWVERDCYASFKALVDRRGLTVTDAIKALVRMYESEAESLMGRGGAHESGS